MIHAYSKFIKGLNEDFKTYATIGQLRYLPADLFWKILRSSTVLPESMPTTAGALEDFELWPSWKLDNTTDSTKDSTERVEPDVFIRFSRFDLIIEAKKTDSGGQREDQWARETKAYHNEYKHDKDMILLALGGNYNLNCNTDGKYKHVHKATWIRLLHAVHECREQRSSLSCRAESTEQEIRILEAVEEVFAQYNEYIVKLLETMPRRNMNIDTILNINEIWETM